MSWHLSPSFFCLHIGPALSLYARIYIFFKPRFQVFIVCPCALGSSSSQPRTLLPCLVPFSCLHLFVLAGPGLSFLRLPLWEACVCTPWSHRDPSGFVFLLDKQGAERTCKALLNEALCNVLGSGG